MVKRKASRKFFDGENNSGHYNFVLIDREILFSPNADGENVRSSLNLSLMAIGLYAVIKAHAIDKNFCFPSLLTLKALTGATKETLIKYIRELEIAGLIIVEKNPGNAGRDRNVYVIPHVEKERLKMEAFTAPGRKGRQSEPLAENQDQRSAERTIEVGNDDLQRSDIPTVNRLNNNTKEVKLNSTKGKINFEWDEWEFLDTGNARNKVTGKEYPVRKIPFALPIDIVMKIDEYYPLYKK